MTSRSDPLAQPTAPDRVFYATGTLLGAGDFQAEQLYHRGQLARTLAHLHGAGTVAGLRVEYQAATEVRPERIAVEPGLAIDRLGRLVEVPRLWCIRLADWFQAQPDDRRTAALRDVTIPVPDDGGDPPVAAPLTVTGVMADVFLRFVACERGLTPAFPGGPFDALDAVAPSRIRDAFALTLLLRDDADPQTPAPPSDSLAGISDSAVRALASAKAALNGWITPDIDAATGRLRPLREHQRDQDPTSIFLARVVIPADPGPPVTRRTDDPVVDNYSRRFVYGTPGLARLLGV